MKNIPMAIRRLIITLALAGFVTMVVGCKNTARGAGQDMERAGEKIQEKTQ